ncbi:MAG: hypothetical protein KAQ85_03335, partial [Thermodesulfovibrionia bacterium]|nr:hypothetical protein [Thermodesulfovibrionia bacterium]
ALVSAFSGRKLWFLVIHLSGRSDSDGPEMTASCHPRPRDCFGVIRTANNTTRNQTDLTG